MSDKSMTYPRTGVAYIAVMEHEYMSANKLTVCNNCLAMGFDKPLKRCNGCMLVDYCSKECQRANWKKHKPFCNMVQGRGRRDGYLAAMPNREEVGRCVVDAYRLRMEMDHVSRGEDHGIYWSEENRGKVKEQGLVWVEGGVVEDFQRWLDLCEGSGILPEWWRFEDRMEVLGAAIDEKDDESVYRKIDQENLMTRYGGDTQIRNALCILAELVVGYDGKGRAMNDDWYMQFSEFLDLHPQERARLMKGTIDAVKGVREEHGDVLGQVGA